MTLINVIWKGALEAQFKIKLGKKWCKLVRYGSMWVDEYRNTTCVKLRCDGNQFITKFDDSNRTIVFSHSELEELVLLYLATHCEDKLLEITEDCNHGKTKTY